MQTPDEDIVDASPSLTQKEQLQLELMRSVELDSLKQLTPSSRREVQLMLIRSRVASAWIVMHDDWLLDIVREMQNTRWSLLEVDRVLTGSYKDVHALQDIKKELKCLVDFVLFADHFEPSLAMKALSELQGQLLKYLVKLSTFDLAQIEPGETRDHVQDVQEAVNGLLNRAFVPLSITLANQLPDYHEPANILQRISTRTQRKLYRQVLATKIRETLFKDKRLLEIFLTDIIESYNHNTGSTGVWLDIEEEFYLYAVVRDLMLEIFSQQAPQFAGWQLPLELRADTDHIRTASDLQITNSELAGMFHIIQTMEFINLMEEGLAWLLDVPDMRLSPRSPAPRTWRGPAAEE